MATTEELVKKVPSWLCCNAFDETMLKSFMEFYFGLQVNGAKEAIIYIDSRGGKVSTLNSIASIVENSSIHFHTCVIGNALSAGLLLLGAGHTRWAAGRSTLMFHDAISGTSGHLEEMEESVELSKKQAREALGRFAKRTNENLKWWLGQSYATKKFHYYFGPKEAKKLGVVDHIGVPQIQIDTPSQPEKAKVILP